jgi:hypothetical protein
MEQAIKEVGEKATLPKTPSRVFGKELDEYTGPHSDFVRPERGLKSLDEPVKVVDTTIVEKKLSPTEVEFFEDMLRAGDPYDFKAVVPSAVMRTGEKGEKYLRAEGEKGLNDLFEFLNPSLESGHQWFLPGEMPSQMRNYKWFDRFKNVDEPVKKGLKALDEPDINSILKSDEALEQYGKDWKNVNRLSKSQRQKQKSKIKDAAKQFEEGTLTGKEFRNVVKSELPIKPINKMVDVPEFDEIIGALKPKQVKTGIVGLTKDLTGQRVATRLDIPSYDNYNKWIVSIHEGLKGPATGYAKSARLTDVVFGSSPKTGLKIAKGDINKSTIARMEGNWNNIADDDTISFAEQLLKRKKNGKYIDEVGEEWIQVGMNPYRASYFYDKATGQALQAAEEVIQVGPLVFARGARKPTLSEYKKGFTVQTGKGKKVFKQGGQILTGLDDKVLYRKEGGLSSINEPININGQPHNLAWINPDEASVLRAMGGSGKKVDGIPAYYFDDPDSWTDATAIEDTSQDSDDDQPIRGMTPQEKADMIKRALEGRGDTSLWKNPDTGTVHKIEEPKQVEEEPDDRSWFARILESVGESLLYFLTGGAVDYEHSGRDMIGGDITRWGEQQPKGTVDLSLPSATGLASMVTPTFNVGVPGQSDKAMSMVKTPVTRLLAPLFTGNKDTESKFISRDAQRRHGLDALKKKLDEE